MDSVKLKPINDFEVYVAPSLSLIMGNERDYETNAIPVTLDGHPSKLIIEFIGGHLQLSVLAGTTVFGETMGDPIIEGGREFGLCMSVSRDASEGVLPDHDAAAWSFQLYDLKNVKTIIGMPFPEPVEDGPDRARLERRFRTAAAALVETIVASYPGLIADLLDAVSDMEIASANADIAQAWADLRAKTALLAAAKAISPTRAASGANEPPIQVFSQETPAPLGYSFIAPGTLSAEGIASLSLISPNDGPNELALELVTGDTLLFLVSPGRLELVDERNQA